MVGDGYLGRAGFGPPSSNRHDRFRPVGGPGPAPHSPVGHLGKVYSVLIGSKPRSRSFRRERGKAGAVGPSRGPDQELTEGRTCPAAAGVGGRLPAYAPVATEGVVIIWTKVVTCNAFQGAHQLDAFHSECGVPGASSARALFVSAQGQGSPGPGGPGPESGAQIFIRIKPSALPGRPAPYPSLSLFFGTGGGRTERRWRTRSAA